MRMPRRCHKSPAWVLRTSRYFLFSQVSHSLETPRNFTQLPDLRLRSLLKRVSQVRILPGAQAA
jgi:hypothetical protein